MYFVIIILKLLGILENEVGTVTSSTATEGVGCFTKTKMLLIYSYSEYGKLLIVARVIIEESFNCYSDRFCK